MEPADPWPGIAAAVTRRGASWPSRDAFHPEQAIDLERALRAACLDGPRSARLDDQGHLGVGARADFLVLPGEAFAASFEPREHAGLADLLAQIRPLATVLDGEVIWLRTRLRPGVRSAPLVDPTDRWPGPLEPVTADAPMQDHRRGRPGRWAGRVAVRRALGTDAATTDPSARSRTARAASTAPRRRADRDGERGR